MMLWSPSRVALGLVALLAVPMFATVLSATPFQDNDAGSGGDAPNGPDPTFRIVDATRYVGRLVDADDRRDWYAFDVEGPDTEVNVRAWGYGLSCPLIAQPDGTWLTGSICDNYLTGMGLYARPRVGGTHYVVFQPDVHLASVFHTDARPVPRYEFVLDYDLNPPFPNGEGSYHHNDAGSNRDAIGHWGSYVWPQPDRVYEGQLLGVLDDRADWYQLDLPDAETIQVRLETTALLCPTILAPYDPIPSTCREEGDVLIVDANLTHAGRHYITIKPVFAPPWVIGSTTPGAYLEEYRFSYALDGDAPDPGQ